MKPLTVFIILICIFYTADAQVKKKIKKSRRYKSQSQYMLEKNEFQYEWEAGYETFSNTLQTVTYPNMVFHYGLSKRMEINSEATLLSVLDHSQPMPLNTSGIEPVAFGMNYLLLPEAQKHPAVIASVQLAIPFLATKNFAASHLAPAITMNVRQPLSKKVTLGFAPGITWDGFSSIPFYLYNFDMDVNLSSRWQLSPELFGFISTNSAPQHNFDVELDHKFSEKVLLGITVGAGLTAASHKSYVAICGIIDLHPKIKKHYGGHT